MNERLNLPDISSDDKKGKFLIICALHGDEDFSLSVVKELGSKLEKRAFDYIIGNPKALEKNTRFTESDLNRIAPGNPRSKDYEKRRAAKIIEHSNEYRFVLDIHGTDSEVGIFSLITNPTIGNFLLAASLPIKNVVVWAAKSSIKSGPVTQFTHNPAIEIECGPKNSKKVANELRKALEKFINNSNPNIDQVIANMKKQKYYQVTGKIENIDIADLEEFKKAKFKSEDFYPLLINAYKNGSTRKMKRLDLFEVLSY